MNEQYNAETQRPAGQTVPPAQNPAPQPPKRIRRVGTFTFGLLLVVAGVVLILRTVVPSLDLRFVVNLLPVALIALGIEVLVYASRPNVRLKYDGLSIFVCILILMGVGGSSIAVQLWNEYGISAQTAQMRLGDELEKSATETLRNVSELNSNVSDLSVVLDFNHGITDIATASVQPGDRVELYVTVYAGRYDSPKAFATMARQVVDTCQAAGLPFNRYRFDTYYRDVTDNMVTYCPEEKILFSNDAFGQHYASSERVADDAHLPVILAEAKKYYANIIMCYGKQAQGAVEIVSGLELEAIYPSHGVLWSEKHIPTILDAYRTWSNNEPEGGAIVVYDSMWHSTEKMAQAIVEGFTQKGISVKLFDLKENHNSDIMPDLLTSKYIAVGSPTLNNNMLPTVAAFCCYMKGLSPKNRKAFAFGSYGWGGQSIKQVEAELEACGFEICLEAQRIQYIPSKEQLLDLTEKVKAL